MRLLTEEQKDIIDSIHKFLEEELKPHVGEMDAKGEFPEEIYRKSFDIGLNAIEIPEEYGGLGLDYATLAAIYEEMGYFDAGIALTMCTTNLALKPVLIAGNDAQKQLFADRILESGYASFALTEPGGGSDVASTRTKAVREGDEYVINGSKCFITNGAYAGVYVCVASTDPSKGAKGLTAFIVERDRPGISIGKEEDKMGIRLTNTVIVNFDDVRIPASNRLGKEGEGFKIAMKTLDLSRPFVASIAVGMAQRCLDEAVKYSKERVTFGRPISAFQALRFMMADMDIKVETARQMVCHAVYLMTNKLPFSREAAISKCYCTDILNQVTTDAVQVLGGYGYMKEYPVEKIFRDAKIFQIFEGTNQVQRVVISGHLLG